MRRAAVLSQIKSPKLANGVLKAAAISTKAPLPPAFAPSFSLRFVKILPPKQPINVLFVFTSRSDPMNNDANDLDEAGEALTANDLSDEALEAAASGDGRRAITWAYCSNYWTCWPL